MIGRSVRRSWMVWLLVPLALACGRFDRDEPAEESASAASTEAPTAPAASEVDESAPAPTTAADAAEELRRAAAEAEIAAREAELEAREDEIARRELEERERRVRERERELAEREARLRAERETVAAQKAAEAAAEEERRAREAAEREAALAQAEVEDVAGSDVEAADVEREPDRGDDWGDEDWRTGNRSEDRSDRDGDVEATGLTASPELLRAGMRLAVRVDETLSSGTSRTGDQFQTVLVDDVRTDDGTLVAPAGSVLWGEVVEARPLRRVGGQAALGIALDRLVLPTGETVELRATLLELGKNQKGDKAKIAGAVIAGAILGSILGDSEGALAGAAAGAAASTAYVVKSKGREVEIPAGTELTVEVDEVVTVRTEYRVPGR